MRWVLAATLAWSAVIASGAIAAATALSASEPPDPCVLITTADASTVLGSTPGKPRTTAVGTARSCTYVVKKKTLTVATSRVATQSAFDKAARRSGLAIQILGAGADAWSVSEGKGLLVWAKGIEVSFSFGGVSPFVATQQSLAKTAVGRL